MKYWLGNKNENTSEGGLTDTVEAQHHSLISNCVFNHPFNTFPFGAICSSVIECSATGLTKAMVCAILSGMVHIKDTLLLIGNSTCNGRSRFPLYLSGPLP